MKDLHNELSRGGSFHPTNKDTDDVINDQIPTGSEHKTVSDDDKDRINAAAITALQEAYKTCKTSVSPKSYELGFMHGAIAEHEYLINRD